MLVNEGHIKIEIHKSLKKEMILIIPDDYFDMHSDIITINVAGNDLINDMKYTCILKKQ